MFSREIVTTIAIIAPPARVWAVLTDFSAYAAWSPFVRSITGELRTGARIAVSLSPDGAKEFRFRPVLRVVNPGRELRWLGQLPVPRLFDGEHRFVLHADGDGGTRLEHAERFSGLLIPFMTRMLSETEAAFGRMNLALKARCEATS